MIYKYAYFITRSMINICRSENHIILVRQFHGMDIVHPDGRIDFLAF